MMNFLDKRYKDDKKERLLHEMDAKRTIQIEQTHGVVGYFYRMYINDSRNFALKFNGKKILDIGAGDGIILEGSDLNPIEMDVSMKRCKRLSKKQNRVICGNGFYIPLKDNSIDCVLLIAVLEHTSKPELVIDEVWRVLKKNGEAAILVPNDILMSIGRIFLLKFPPRYPGHITFITPTRINKWLNSRFQITREYSLPLPQLSFWMSMYYFVYVRKQA